MTASGPDRATERALHWIIAGQVVSTAGSASALFCLSFVIFRVTHSVAMMVLFQFIYWAPAYWLGFLAGIEVDRFGARRILIWANVAGIATAAVLAASLGPLGSPVVVLLAAALLQASTSSFLTTALRTIIPAMTTTDRLQTVNGRVAAAQSIALTVGPAAAGVMLATLPIALVFVLDAASYAVALWAVMRSPLVRTQAARATEPLLHQLTQGARWIASCPALKWLCVFFALGTGFNGMASGLVAAYILVRTGGDATSLAVTNVCMMLGVLGGGLATGRLGRRWSPFALILVGCLGSALGRVGLGLGSAVPAWAASQAGRGVGATVAATTSTRVFQELAPAEMRGRVLGAQYALNGALLPLAILLGGFVGTTLASAGSVAFGYCFVAYGVLELATLPILFRAAALPGGNVLSASPVERGMAPASALSALPRRRA